MKTSDLELIRYVRKLKNVHRCAGTRLMRPYTLDSHGAQVAELFYLAAIEEGIPLTARMMYMAMNHDLMETMTGDLLYPVKNASPESAEAWNVVEREVARIYGLEAFTDDKLEKALGPEAYDLFKACDMLELYFTVREEIASGNTNEGIQEIEQNAVDALMKHRDRFPAIRRLMALSE